MVYPTGEDYIRAVQEPERVFVVPALRGAAFELHPRFGIPMPASGNAAVVFKADVGGADAALRFFIREDASSRERYTALGRYVAERGIDDCVARAVWVDDAIAINGSTWPMVHMSWVDGRTLDAYVGHLAGAADVGALASLARTWRDFVGRLQAAEFAHGDLQHGNVLVNTSSDLQLVDFDGSWIAAFEGGPPPKETGHPNYQRTGREWGRWMDTFPGLVIYTALLALSRRPACWAELHNGENMLFSAGDFDPPFQTATWQVLSGIGDADVERAVERLKVACDSRWRAGDTLESLLDTRTSAQMTGSPPFPGVGDAGRTPWWQMTAAGGSTAEAPPHRQPTLPVGSKMPPPPPKSTRAAATQASPSFAHTRPTGSWYPAAGSTPPRVSRPPAQGGPRLRPVPPRPPGETAALALAAAALTALVAYGVVQGAGGNGGIAALLCALCAAVIAVPLLQRKG